MCDLICHYSVLYWIYKQQRQGVWRSIMFEILLLTSIILIAVSQILPNQSSTTKK